MFKPIDFASLSPQVNCYNEMDYVQTVNLVEVYDNPELGLKIARYNKYSFLIRSGILTEAVKYMQAINPNYAIARCPSYSKFGMLTTVIGNVYTYGSLYDGLTDELGSPSEAVDTLQFYTQLVNAYDVGKYYLINNDTVEILGKILAKVVKPILKDIETNINLPYFNTMFNNFMNYSLGLYSVGQYIVDKEFRSIGQFWKTLRLELYNSLYSIDNRVSSGDDNIDDSITNIKITHETLPTISMQESDIAKGYLYAFNYPSGKFEDLYCGTIGRINECYCQLKSVPCSYDNREVSTPSIGMNNEVRIAPDILNILIKHYDETHGIISEMFRGVCSIDEFGKDNTLFADPYTVDIPLHSKLFKVVSDLSVYLPILRLTISLVYARTTLQKQE